MTDCYDEGLVGELLVRYSLLTMTAQTAQQPGTSLTLMMRAWWVSCLRDFIVLTMLQHRLSSSQLES